MLNAIVVIIATGPDNLNTCYSLFWYFFHARQPQLRAQQTAPLSTLPQKLKEQRCLGNLLWKCLVYHGGMTTDELSQNSTYSDSLPSTTLGYVPRLISVHFLPSPVYIINTLLLPVYFELQ